MVNLAVDNSAKLWWVLSNSVKYSVKAFGKMVKYLVLLNYLGGLFHMW